MFIIATAKELDKIEERCKEIMCYDCLFNKMDACHKKDIGSIIHDIECDVYFIERK